MKDFLMISERFDITTTTAKKCPICPPTTYDKSKVCFTYYLRDRKECAVPRCKCEVCFAFE